MFCRSCFSISALRATSKAFAKEVDRVKFCLGIEKSANEGEMSGMDVIESAESGGKVNVGEDVGLKSRRSSSKSGTAIEVENDRLWS